MDGCGRRWWMMWSNFKNFVYILGWTTCIGIITVMNLRIVHEMWWTAPWWAVIAILLFTTSLYPIWIIGLIGIGKLWKLEMDDAQFNKKGSTPGVSS
jgi:hypothetical protein